MEKLIHCIESNKFKSLDNSDFNFLLALLQIGDVHIEDSEIIFTPMETYNCNPNILVKALNMPETWCIISCTVKAPHKIILNCDKILPESILNNVHNHLYNKPTDKFRLEIEE